MSRWYRPPAQRARLADLELDRIAGLVASATSDAVFAGEMFSLTKYGQEHGAEKRWFAAAPGPDLAAARKEISRVE